MKKHSQFPITQLLLGAFIVCLVGIAGLMIGRDDPAPRTAASQPAEAMLPPPAAPTSVTLFFMDSHGRPATPRLVYFTDGRTVAPLLYCQGVSECRHAVDTSYTLYYHALLGSCTTTAVVHPGEQAHVRLMPRCEVTP
jgi:hypothetical protein